MVMQDDEIVVHALTKVVNIPGNPRIFTIFLIIRFLREGRDGPVMACSNIELRY